MATKDKQALLSYLVKTNQSKQALDEYHTNS